MLSYMKATCTCTISDTVRERNSARAGMRTIGDFPNLTAAMEHAGWSEAKIRKVMGENWLRLLAEVWGE